jgi:hypothetical protein
VSERIDLGDDHALEFYQWAPDDLPANRASLEIAPGDPMPVVERAGAFVLHKKPDGSDCMGSIRFDTPETQRWPSLAVGARWTVESWEPLTVSPSLLCGCGDHGFIRGGKWVRA